MSEMRNCNRCGELLPVESFYFVSRKRDVRRGQCKACMSEIKQMQKDPAWRPRCPQCGQERERAGPGRRLCWPCFDAKYDTEDRRACGSARLKLKPCSACGTKRLREDHLHGGSLCPICRAVPQGRRKRLKELNVTPREYVALLEAQDYRCAICRRKPRKALAFDHRHAEPRIVRGLLCNPCNTLLATARDRVERLEAASAYLRRPPAQDLLPGREATAAANRKFVPLRRRAAADYLERTAA